MIHEELNETAFRIEDARQLRQRYQTGKNHERKEHNDDEPSGPLPPLSAIAG